MTDFDILNNIASGGFGRVERIRLTDGTIAARKVFCPSAFLGHVDRDKLVARFAREVRIQSHLNEDFVVPVIDSDLTANDPWYIMPLAERSYQEQLEEYRARGQFEWEPLFDILNALEEIHRLGYTHRDLKPQNILLHNGKWKLSDFGLALPPAGMTTRLTSDSAWGTAGYCAPEQARGFHGVKSTADIYAFGCILHDIFGDAARVPYSRCSAPGAIGRIIEKCTEQLERKRFGSVASIRSALHAVVRQPTSPVVPSAQTTQWLDALSSIDTWSREKTEDFTRYIEDLGNGESEPLFMALESEHLELLLQKDEDLANAIAERYCTWVHRTAFRFSFCDVVIDRLLTVLRHGRLAAKAQAALAAAELGQSHNRWYVMGIVVRECGSFLDDQTAERIALEIEIEDAKSNFRRCAATINRSVNSYHPLIAAVLK